MQPSSTPQAAAPAPAPAAAPAAPAPLPNVPATWPGAFGLYRYSKQAVMTNIAPIVEIYVINIVVALALILALKATGRLINDVFTIFFSLVTILIMLAGTSGKKMSLGNALKGAADIKLFLKFFAVALLAGIAIGFGFVLLIVPGVILLPRLILAPYYLVDKKLGVMDSIKASWDESKGSFGKVWGVLGVSFLFGLIAITIIGIPFAIYFTIMYSAAQTLVYRYVSAHPHVEGAPSAQPAPPAAPAAS